MSRRAELLLEGRIATLAGASGFGWVEALAVADGVVLAAGSRLAMDALVGPGTVRRRLGDDQLAMPGITDAHLHLMLLILGERQVDLSGVDGLDDTLAALAVAHRSRADAGDPRGWLLGHGWSLDRLGRWPDAEMLERVCPGRPVALYAHDHHSRWVSREALRLAGITAASADPSGGEIRRAADGEPSGVLHETAAGLVEPVIPPSTDEELEAGLRSQAATLAALGVTGCHDPGELGGNPDLRRVPLFYRQMAAQGRLPLRVHASVRAPQLDQAIELGLTSGQGVPASVHDPLAMRRAERYRMGWLKLFSDGSLGSRSAALLEPYDDADRRPPTGGPRGMFLGTAEELAHDVQRAAAAGISSQVHAIGDAAVRLALDLLADVPRSPLARRVEHAQLIHPADQPRFGRLGIAASVQPVHLRSDATAAREAWGERSEYAFPLRSLAEAGAMLPFGTDGPVEPVDPWPGIAVSLTRRDPWRSADQPLGAGEQIGLARALRAACLDPARVANEPKLGRLVAGSRADIIIVPLEGLLGDPLDSARLAETRPLATLIDGELVYGSLD